ncbi:hypothetical protein HPP92_001469 [Vanilla planifolia]|uniref:Uncharacterized protein n=1 Tax=Vanilla planifolia TaxID=51239 RepID=A0A835VGZ2_VANPL|nr:hypothetical protein HPP92_001469 [Vanilla planifolia]
MCIELFYSTHLHFLVGEEMILNPAHMNDFEHGGMLLMFFLYGLVALLSEKTRLISSPPSLTRAGNFGFRKLLLRKGSRLHRYAVLHFHSTTHTGLEGYYHLILVILIGLCIASAIAGAFLYDNLAVDVARALHHSRASGSPDRLTLTVFMMPRGCLDDNDTA